MKATVTALQSGGSWGDGSSLKGIVGDVVSDCSGIMLIQECLCLMWQLMFLVPMGSKAILPF